MAKLAGKIDVYIETGSKKTFASALDWPGWARSGSDEAAAVQALMDYGEETALNDVQAGDIVFLGVSGDNSSILDAGIYMGNGQYIHASKSAGYVRLDGLNESGSDGKPVFARRIFR